MVMSAAFCSFNLKLLVLAFKTLVVSPQKPKREGPCSCLTTPQIEAALTQVVRTLAAALSKWKARTLLMPSVMRVNT